MALKRPVESPAFEQYREMMREEILDPLKIQISAVEAKADESLRGVAALQDQARTIDGHLDALEAQSTSHAQSISALQERRDTGASRSNCLFTGTGGTRAAHGQHPVCTQLWQSQAVSNEIRNVVSSRLKPLRS